MATPDQGRKEAPRDPARRAMHWIGSVSSLVVHTVFFAASFSLALFGVDLEEILLVVTTIVSLEAIYMAIFIQMAVNQNTQSLDEVQEDVEEIQEDVEGMERDIDEIQEDVDEIQEDVEEIQEDVEEIQDEQEEEEAQPRQGTPEEILAEDSRVLLGKIEQQMQSLISEIEKLKKGSS